MGEWTRGGNRGMKIIMHLFVGETFHIKAGPRAVEATPVVSPTRQELGMLEASLRPGDRVIRSSLLRYEVLRP